MSIFNLPVASLTFLMFRWSFLYAAAAAGLSEKSTSRSLTTSGRNSNSVQRKCSDKIQPAAHARKNYVKDP